MGFGIGNATGLVWTGLIVSTLVIGHSMWMHRKGKRTRVRPLDRRQTGARLWDTDVFTPTFAPSMLGGPYGV